MLRVISKPLSRGAQSSYHDYEKLLREEFASMQHKQKWIVLPYKLIKDLHGLRLTPPGVVSQRERRTKFICNYSFSDINENTVPIAPMEAMKFGHALDRIIRNILLSDPKCCPTYLQKVDISNGFYRIALKVEDITKLAVIFPTKKGCELLVAFSLFLPIGWTNLPPKVCAGTKTITDLCNKKLSQTLKSCPHKLDTLATKLDRLVDTTATADSTIISQPSTKVAVPLPCH